MLNWIWGGKEEKKESSGLGGGATEKIVFEGVTVKECLDVISNCEKYTEFIEGCVEARKTKDNEDGTFDVFWKASVGGIINTEYTLRLRVDGDNGFSWVETDHGPFAKNRGCWTLVDLGNGNVEATYSVNIELNIWVPGILRDFLVGTGLPRTMTAFKKRIEGMKK
ncbi:predicted protein [Naegleria gruberi]|uniref:Predicted protein n=1 Tax=Naegleria gruberi TaxID=5762 RepID=D2VIQ9_NAEGR|nr:uncharacterized protein NAEGRDRAFT_68763 [Naegleria gruberi]EFC43393.1 predicted protein [Naegleria gruberi]|eukprot:XP_002676137.1 predicted protein [Naegleria gruberi strain NEG-M]